MKRIIALIVLTMISISGCQQNEVDTNAGNQINESNEIKFSETSYNKMPGDMATTINKKAKKILEDEQLAYEEYAKLEYAGETYIVKGNRREISIEEYKEKYSDAPIPEQIGEYKIKAIVVGSTVSSPYYSIASQEEKEQITSEGIKNDKYTINKQQFAIMEILYEKEDQGISLTIQNTELLKLAQVEEQASLYWYMSIPELQENQIKESEENKNLKVYYDEKTKTYKSMGIYENKENKNLLTKIAFGQLDKVNSYGVDYAALILEEKSQMDPRLIEITQEIESIKLP